MKASSRNSLVLVLLAAVLCGGLLTILRDPPWSIELPAPDSEPFWAPALQDRSAADFELPSPDWKLRLPEDHGAHVETRSESWTIVAHLRTETGEHLGVQFALVRIGVAPPDQSQPRKVWDIDTVYRAHVILTQASGNSAIAEERFGRGVPNLVGFDPERLDLRMDDWVVHFPEAGMGGMTLSLTVQDGAVLHLSLNPEKPPISSAATDEGAPVAGYVLPRLAVEGSLIDGGGARPVTGTAWFDHLWGELPLPGASPIARDRLQIQLSDGTDLSLVRSRRRDGRGAPILDAFLVSPDGKGAALDEGRLQMTPTRTWLHPGTDAGYPVEWQVSGPGLDLTVEPVLDAQAFDFTIPIWSGLVRVSGTQGGSAVSGMGTMQLTGYAER